MAFLYGIPFHVQVVSVLSGPLRRRQPAPTDHSTKQTSGAGAVGGGGAGSRAIDIDPHGLGFDDDDDGNGDEECCDWARPWQAPHVTGQKV